MQYYWDVLKLDISKILLSDARNPDYAKSISMKVFAISHETKDDMIKAYCELCRLIFIYKFIHWRLNRLQRLELPIQFDWGGELPQIKAQIEYYEDYLFGGLEPFAAAILITLSKKGRPNSKTRLSFRKIKWEMKESNISSLSLDGEISIADDEESQPLEVDQALQVIEDKHVLRSDDVELQKGYTGPCPTFRFMPTKVQFIKMIVKAAFNPLHVDDEIILH